MPEGTGPLFLELERLKMRLEEEGLFEPSRKRPLPRFPRVVGLVTSPTGAVLHDICNVISRRYPLVEILLAPTLVQGDEAAPGIASALQALNRDGRPDVIVLARGGGSLEELWPFNKEVVARAIYASHIPVVSAVGHETDYTISDYVADVRAPTPSAAAELVVPDGTVLKRELDTQAENILQAMSHHLSSRRQQVDSLGRRMRGRAPDIDSLRRRVDDLGKAMGDALSNRLSLLRERVNGRALSLQALNPDAILYRGYALVQRRSDAQIVSMKDQVSDGEALTVTVSDGAFPVIAGNPTTGNSTAGSPYGKTRSRNQAARAGARLI
jgi:exodeoxyribonuclease VII large subunit